MTSGSESSDRRQNYAIYGPIKVDFPCATAILLSYFSFREGSIRLDSTETHEHKLILSSRVSLFFPSFNIVHTCSDFTERLLCHGFFLCSSRLSRMNKTSQYVRHSSDFLSSQATHDRKVSAEKNRKKLHPKPHRHSITTADRPRLPREIDFLPKKRRTLTLSVEMVGFCHGNIHENFILKLQIKIVSRGSLKFQLWLEFHSNQT